MRTLLKTLGITPGGGLETTSAALEEFQSRWSKRPLDALGLTAAILITVQTTEQAVLEAKQHLLELTTGYRLTRFIDERAASDDYRKLLGVLATVRQDFSKLSALMHEPPETSVVSDNARIDRIVLYIDDLDRCPPNVVVDVLQAVHLLLAFKLFVVVVGVDARWISESLEQKHRALRTKSQEEGGRAVLEESSVIGYEVKPHDYLEKIFQVPFWLDKPESKTTSRYIGNLLAEDVFRAATPAAPVNVAAATDGGIAGNAPGVQTRRPHYTLGEGEAPEADPKQLTIDQKELAYMTNAELAQLVGRSPRTAKRFAPIAFSARASRPNASTRIFTKRSRRSTRARCCCSRSSSGRRTFLRTCSR